MISKRDPGGACRQGPYESLRCRHLKFRLRLGIVLEYDAVNLLEMTIVVVQGPIFSCAEEHLLAPLRIFVALNAMEITVISILVTIKKGFGHCTIYRIGVEDDS